MKKEKEEKRKGKGGKNGDQNLKKKFYKSMRMFFSYAQ